MEGKDVISCWLTTLQALGSHLAFTCAMSCELSSLFAPQKRSLRTHLAFFQSSGPKVSVGENFENQMDYSSLYFKNQMGYSSLYFKDLTEVIYSEPMSTINCSILFMKQTMKGGCICVFDRTIYMLNCAV